MARPEPLILPLAQPAALQLHLDADVLRPLIAAVVEEVVARLKDEQAQIGERLAYSEAEAAALLGLARHQLRDERLRGRIGSSRGPGGRVMYAKEDLLAYLAARRVSE